MFQSPQLMAEVTMDTTCGTRDDPRRLLYILLSGAEGGGPRARAAKQAGDEELAESFHKGQEAIVEAARERLAHRVPGLEKDPSPFSQEPYEDVQIEFAARAAKRLETVADRLEGSGRLEGDGVTLACAQELRMAAFMVRDEAEVMARRAAADPRRGRHLLRAAGEPDQGPIPS